MNPDPAPINDLLDKVAAVFAATNPTEDRVAQFESTAATLRMIVDFAAADESALEDQS